MSLKASLPPEPPFGPSAFFILRQKLRGSGCSGLVFFLCLLFPEEIGFRARVAIGSYQGPSPKRWSWAVRGVTNAWTPPFFPFSGSRAEGFGSGQWAAVSTFAFCSQTAMIDKKPPKKNSMDLVPAGKNNKKGLVTACALIGRARSRSTCVQFCHGALNPSCDA